jgi:hypothetical protein
VLCSFGREDTLDRQGVARLVRSISRFLDPADAVAATVPSEVKITDVRPMSGVGATLPLIKWITGPEVARND